MEKQKENEVNELLKEIIRLMEERTQLSVELRETIEAEGISTAVLDKLETTSKLFKNYLKAEEECVDRLETLVPAEEEKQ